MRKCKKCGGKEDGHGKVLNVIVNFNLVCIFV